MKKLITLCFAVTALQAVSTVPAFATFVQTIEVYNYSVGGEVNWVHTYDHSADPALSASLTIVADDVDGPPGPSGEEDAVWASGDNGATWNYLGLLNQMPYYSNWSYYPGPGNPNDPNELTTTVFTINPSWLDSMSMPVKINIDSTWGVEIETSTLTVTAVPEPTTICLLSLGVLGLIRRKR